MLGITRLHLKQPATKKLVIELAWTNWFGRWMWNRNWGGLTTPLPWLVLINYWLLPSTHVDPEVRYHEFMHVKQDERDGWFLLNWIRYAWAGRHGYAKNARELEAYAETAKAVEAGLPEWVL